MIQSQKLISSSNKKILILFKPQSQSMCVKKPQYDMISSPDRISNLCHIKYAVRENETPMEKKLHKEREELQAWNEAFWTKHNLNFINKKKEFLTNELSKKGSTNDTLSAEEISVFYKDFLDKNWKNHLTYLTEWYRRNVFVTYLHFRVNINKMFKKVFRNV